MGSVKEDIIDWLLKTWGYGDAEDADQILSLVCKRIEGVNYPKRGTKDKLLLDCLNLGFEEARQTFLDVIKEE